MSVIMTFNGRRRPQGGWSSSPPRNTEKMQAVLEAAKSVTDSLRTASYGSDDGGSLMVLDEWPDRHSFESFFREQQAEIGPMMEAAGVTSQPEPAFWNELATHDTFGWGA